jgi:hypothetical protein
MSTDASTIPLQSRGFRAALLEERIGALRRLSRRPAVQANTALCIIVLSSALVVVAAAGRPTFLSATTRAHYFPNWMAGPLGGLLPGLAASATLKTLFSGTVVLAYAAYLLALKRADALRTRTVVAAIVAVHLIFLLSPPLALTDVFNYFNYARMEVIHHLNPYTTIPALEPHGDPAFALSNWHGLLSPYGPLFTILTFAAAPLSLAAFFWSFKVLLLVADLGMLLLVWGSARLLERDPLLAFERHPVLSRRRRRRLPDGRPRAVALRVDPLTAIVLVGLNPVVLIWGLGGDHNDFLTIFLVVLGFYLLLRARAAALVGDASTQRLSRGASSLRAPRRTSSLRVPRGIALDLAAGVCLVAATGLKASAGILIPIVLASLVRSPRRLIALLAGMIAAAVLASLASVLAFGTHFPDLSLQGSLVTDLSLPNLLGLALGQGGETGVLRELITAALVCTVLACCVAAWRRREALTPSGWAMVAVLVTLSWVLPWYVLWILPLAALAGSRRLRTAALVLGAYLILAWVPATGEILAALHLHPAKTAVGRSHALVVDELLH